MTDTSQQTYEETVDDAIQAINTPASSGISQPSSVVAWVMWSCAAIFYLYEYALRVSPSVMTAELMQSFGVSAKSLGVLVSFYYLAYVPLQIPCGVIVDKLGPRIVITASAILCTIGSFLFAFSDNLMVAQITRFMLGAGSACAYLSTAKVASQWFSSERFALLAGVTMMMGTFGGICGGIPFAYIVNAFGWQQSMIFSAFVGFGVVAACWFVLRDREVSDTGEEVSSVKYGFLEGLNTVVRSPQCWLIGIYGGLMYVPLSAFAELWGVPYFMKVYELSNGDAAYSSAMVFVGMAVGCVLGPIFSNYIQSRVKVMSWAALLTLVAFMVSLYVPNIPYELNCALLFVAGVFSGGQILYFAAAKELIPVHFTGTTVGFINALVMVSGLIFQPLLGWLLDWVHDGTINPDGTPLYTTENYQIALTAIPVSLIIAWLIMLFVRETYPRRS